MVHHLSQTSRRAFLAASLALATHVQLTARQGGTKLILLGTGGGPRPRKASSGSAQVVVSNGVPYVIDCGDGVARQLAFAGVPLPSLRHIFITHQHSDHTADYGNVILLAWTAGLRTRVDTWGPPPLDRMTKLFFEMNASDIDIRVANEGRPPLAPLVHVHELRDSGVVMADDNVKVTSTLVDHPPVVPAFAYRFDARERSIVISGDTAPSQNLVKLAAGADVLVHSVMYPAAIDRLVARAERRGAEGKYPCAPDVGRGCGPPGPGGRCQDARTVPLCAAGRLRGHRCDVARSGVAAFSRNDHRWARSSGDLRNGKPRDGGAFGSM